MEPKNKPTNAEISRILHEIAIYLEMDEIPFKPRAYEKAAKAIDELENQICDLYEEGGLRALEKIEGVGVSIAEKIEELIKKGVMEYHEDLKKKVPVDLESFAGIDGLGPKKIKKLYQELKIKNLGELEKAAKAGRISALKEFGKKSEANILKSIEFLKLGGQRFLRWHAEETIEKITDNLKKINGVERVDVCGSIRRKKETIGDADILAIANNAEEIMDYFVSMNSVLRINGHGATKSSVKLRNGMNIDLRIVEPNSYGAVLSYFTGSKDHNVKLRQIAVNKGFKLNEYGLYEKCKIQNSKCKMKMQNSERPEIIEDKGIFWERIGGQTEKEIYEKLGLEYVEPEMREDKGEIELAQKGKLPKLIGYDILKGDLHAHSNATDGVNTIEEMAMAAIGMGYEYILISDHTKRLAMTHGLDEKRLLEQMIEIGAINEKLKAKNIKFRILKGSEVDILKDGSLDIDDEVLEQLDVVGVAIHSYFNLDEKEQTGRMIKAMENKNVDIIYHPTGRILNKRPPYKIDMDKIIAAAKRTKTVLEIDAYPDRMDLKDDHVRKCVEAGVKLAIDTDAHSIHHLQYIKYGIDNARRGWATKADIINAWPAEKMLEMLK